VPYRPRILRQLTHTLSAESAARTVHGDAVSAPDTTGNLGSGELLADVAEDLADVEIDQVPA
jgi:hypothetical protein